MVRPDPSAGIARRSRCLAASNRLAHLESLELRVIKIQRFVVPCTTMRCAERLRFGPRLEHSPAFPHSVRGVERVILSFRTLEKVKLYKARHLVEMTVARKPNLLERCFGPFGNSKTVHRDKHRSVLSITACTSQQDIG